MRKSPLPSKPAVFSVVLLGAVIVVSALTYKPPRMVSASEEHNQGSGIGDEEGSSSSSEETGDGWVLSVEEGLTGHSDRLRVTLAKPGEPIEGVAIEGACDLRWKAAQGEAIEEAVCKDGGLLSPPAVGAWTLESPHSPKLSTKTAVRRVTLGGKAEDPSEQSWRPVPGMLDVLVLRPREEKERGMLNGYRVGTYRPRPRNFSNAYEPPPAFIEVTEETQDFPVSDHFRLGEFLTKDQEDVWPKYLVLDLRLIDLLELVLEELRGKGHEASGFFIMSGYRTPYYNGPGSGGRAAFSRHIFGDAADVWLDESGDGRMDDLTGDGRSSIKDARVIAGAAEKLQKRHPDLAGGIGVYGPRGSRGPFVHIDVRGEPASW